MQVAFLLPTQAVTCGARSENSPLFILLFQKAQRLLAWGRRRLGVGLDLRTLIVTGRPPQEHGKPG